MLTIHEGGIFSDFGNQGGMAAESRLTYAKHVGKFL